MLYNLFSNNTIGRNVSWFIQVHKKQVEHLLYHRKDLDLKKILGLHLKYEKKIQSDM